MTQGLTTKKLSQLYSSSTKTSEYVTVTRIENNVGGKYMFDPPGQG